MSTLGEHPVGTKRAVSNNAGSNAEISHSASARAAFGWNRSKLRIPHDLRRICPDVPTVCATVGTTIEHKGVAMSVAGAHAGIKVGILLDMINAPTEDWKLNEDYLGALEMVFEEAHAS